MNLSRADLVYLVANIMHMYIVYLLLSLFLAGKVRNKIETAITYIVYYISLCIVSIVVGIPFLTMATNIIMFFILAGQYEVKLRKRILIVFNIQVLLFLSEAIVVVFVGFLVGSMFQINVSKSIIGIILAKILSFVVIGALSMFRNIKKEYQFPTSYWIALIIIPITSIYLMILILESKSLKREQGFLGLVGIMISIIFTFYLYDMMNQFFDGKVEKVVLEERNKYYARRLITMKDSLVSVQKLQHDWKNHLIELGMMVQEGEKEKALKYLEDVNGAIYSVKSYVNTGNLDIDGIINYKLQEAEKEGIKVNFKANIPESLNISPFDCAIILGNLFDNAVEGARTCQAEKSINGKIYFSKGTLFFILENSYAGIVKCKGDKIITSKKDKQNHGMGLKNVRLTVEKYYGSIDVSYDENYFKVDLLIFLE